MGAADVKGLCSGGEVEQEPIGCAVVGWVGRIETGWADARGLGGSVASLIVRKPRAKGAVSLGERGCPGARRDAWSTEQGVRVRAGEAAME